MDDRLVETSDIDARIVEYLRNEVILDDGSDLTVSTPLLSGLLDSIALMDLVAFLEDEFGVAIEYADVDSANFRTVSDISRLVRRTERS